MCWGKVWQQEQETMWERRPPVDQREESGCDEDGRPWGEWDEIVDYALCSTPSEARRACRSKCN